MNRCFSEIKKNFGFGFMRLPEADEKIDMEATCRMVDAFMDAGFNYFDTAHPYHHGQSEVAIRECVAKRYDRSRFVLANKLSGYCFETLEEIEPLFELQLELCGVTYFDFYLMHAMSAARHQKFKEMGVYDVVRRLKAEGKARHLGFSFHDAPEALEQILCDLPDMEFVQLQFNYVDYHDSRVRSRECYEICRRHGKPVFVMEPVKGGSLVNLPEAASKLMTEGSPASYAIRYAAGFEGIEVVLSGMSNEEQVADNISFMKNFKPLTEDEQRIIARVRTLYQAQHRIPCTACRYCVDGCPANISIPDVFACMNQKLSGEGEPEKAYGRLAANAHSCVECGQCEAVCPQNLHIRQLLKEVDAAFS